MKMAKIILKIYKSNMIIINNDMIKNVINIIENGNDLNLMMMKIIWKLIIMKIMKKMLNNLM